MENCGGKAAARSGPPKTRRFGGTRRAVTPTVSQKTAGLRRVDLMDVLWAPWRMAYVSGAAQPGGCLFCTAVAATDDPRQGILHRGASAFLILNAFPYASGHLMVATNRHVASPEELDEAESLDLVRLTGRALTALRAVYRPDGFNLGANLGRVAGAGVEGHLHLHVVPRWMGDTNFMPVVGGVKVMPESLEETFRRLRPHVSG